ALLAGFLGCALVLMCWERSWWVAHLRLGVTMAVVFQLYTTLGQLGVAAMPLADAPLAEIDRWMLGGDPSRWVQQFQTPGWGEFYSFVYAAFIPYIYLSLILGCLGRPPLERDQFLTGWALTYAISFLGYVLVPGRGPLADF